MEVNTCMQVFSTNRSKMIYPIKYVVELQESALREGVNEYFFSVRKRKVKEFKSSLSCSFTPAAASQCIGRTRSALWQKAVLGHCSAFGCIFSISRSNS